MDARNVWAFGTLCTQAGAIRQIAASNPMDNVALLRFLLAVLYWCKGNAPAQEEKDHILSDDHLPAEWFAKLEERRDCFNLLGDVKRFYQNQRYRHKVPEHTTNYLIHEIPSGTNKWHFRHATDMVDGLCPACCAMGLIRLPVFATSGGRGLSPSTGKSPGINTKPPLYVIPWGKSLATTLLYSWHPARLGTPEWETSGNQLPQNGEVPLLQGLTWLPRSIWLADPEEPASLCASCGLRERLIQRCVFDGKGSSKAEHRVWRDPHVIYEADDDGKASSLQTSNALGATDAAAGQWASQLASIIRGRRSSEVEMLWVVGFSTVQNDKYLEATECLVPCPVQPQQEQELIESLKQWHDESLNLSRRIRSLIKKDDPKSSSRKHVEIRPAVDAIRQDIESKVSVKTKELIAGDNSAWQSTARAYAPMLEAVAKSLLPGFTTRAIQRRNEIAHATPDMTPKPAAKPRKSKNQKGSGE